MPSRSPTVFILFARCLVALACAALGQAETIVDATSKPGATWRPRPTVQLSDFPAATADEGLDQFGGRPTKGTRVTGFFHTEKLKDRWWLVTPEGGLFFSCGVNSVNQATTKGARLALGKRFGSPQSWASQTAGLLRANGINTLGAWSDHGTLKGASPRLAETLVWSFMASYGKQRGGTYQKPGHTGYPNDCPFIFDPGFATFCEKYAQLLDPCKGDPWVIGHFSDNELPWSRKMLENYLALPPADAGHAAAADWLKNSRGNSGENQPITDPERAGFLAYALDRYLTITGNAVRRHSPAHLFLGPRLHGGATRMTEVFATLGKHVDAVCVNYYGAWSPDEKLLEMWNQESGKPVMITEFYAKAENSGMANSSGAGWLVKTQKDRGAFYQNFAIGLIESRVCIGWHWHRYADNDPDDLKLDPSNRDSNKGIVDNRYEPFPDLLDAMKSINLRTYGLAEHFNAP